MTKIVHIWNPDTGITDIPNELKGWKNSEINGIRESWRLLQEQLKDSALLNEFSARLNREWSIETGALERIYNIDRGTTVTLIERGFREELIRHGATDKPAGYVISVLNDQLEALEGVFDFVKSKTLLTTSYVKQLHQVLTRNQEDADAALPTGDPHAPFRYVKVPLKKGEWKSEPNSPLRNGTRYEYCPPVQVASEMEKLVGLANQHHKNGVEPDLAAAWLHHRFTQIHPFQDGNGRVVRALATLVLLRARLYPLTVQRDDSAYIPALEVADLGDLKPLLDVIARSQRSHFQQASHIAKGLLSSKKSLQDLLNDMEQQAVRQQDDIHKSRVSAERVLGQLQEFVRSQMTEYTAQLRSILRSKKPDADVRLGKSGPSTHHEFDMYALGVAQDRYNYLPNFDDIACWNSMEFLWTKRAQLVFAFHALSRPFNGAIACVPFFLFAPQPLGSFSNPLGIAEEFFVLHANEEQEPLHERFLPWLSHCLKKGVEELSTRL